MKIIGCNFHPGYQPIAVLDVVTGEMVDKALSREREEEVRAFYAGLEGSVRHSAVVVKTGLLVGHPASPKRWGV